MRPILLVDDETAVRRLLKLLLVRRGFEVVEAVDGLRAYSTLQELDGDLSLIISDVCMAQARRYCLMPPGQTGIPAHSGVIDFGQ